MQLKEKLVQLTTTGLKSVVPKVGSRVHLRGRHREERKSVISWM